MGELLPEELIIRIFERLPIKPLIRFTCLSTRWRFIILTDPHFAKSQLLIASQNHTLTPRLVAIFNPHVPYNPEFEYESEPQLQFDIQSNELGENNAGRIRKLQLPFSPQDDVIGICSSNGLVCVAFGTDIYIWNPSTGRHTTLPHISAQLAEIYDIGFGYVSSLDDYKVVANVLVDNEDGVEYHIFSWRAKMWKKMVVPRRCCRREESKSTLWNESIHWLLDDGDNVGVFDLAKEEFRTMLLPISIRHKWDRDGYRGLILGASLGGSLYLLDDDNYGFFVDLWVLEEDSWCKEFPFKISMKPERFFFVMGTMLVGAEDVERGYYMLIRCGDEEEEVLEICRVNENSYGVIEYQETLLWLP